MPPLHARCKLHYSPSFFSQLRDFCFWGSRPDSMDLPGCRAGTSAPSGQLPSADGRGGVSLRARFQGLGLNVPSRQGSGGCRTVALGVGLSPLAMGLPETPRVPGWRLRSFSTASTCIPVGNGARWPRGVIPRSTCGPGHGQKCESARVYLPRCRTPGIRRPASFYTTDPGPSPRGKSPSLTTRDKG